MERKIKIILLSLILIILIVVFFTVGNNKKNKSKTNENIYICSNSQEVSEVNMITEYKVYHKDDIIEKIELNKVYKGKTKKAKDNIANYRYIISAETQEYTAYKGFKVKINKDTRIEYNYTYIFDVSKTDQELKSLFGIFDTMEEQKKYLNNNGYTCE